MRLFAFVFLLISRMSFAALTIHTVLPESNLDLKSAAGEKPASVAFKDLLGKKATVVVFMATQCPYSNAYNQRYNTLASKLKDQGIAFVAVNSNDTESWEKVRQHATDAQQKFNFTVYKDEGHRLADLFQAERTPEAFVLDAQRKLVYHGRIDDDAEGKNVKKEDLLVAATAVASGKQVLVAETKAFGCTIKKK